MEVDINELINRASDSEISLILEHWHRLRNFMQEPQAYKILSNLLADHSLEMLSLLTDEEIVIQHRQTSNKTPSFPQKNVDNEKKSRSSKMISEFQQTKLKEEKSWQKEQKNRRKELNPEKKEMSFKKEEISEESRMKNQISENFKEYKPFIKAQLQQLTNLLDQAFKIKKKSKALSRGEIKNEVEKMRGQRPNSSNIFSYIQLVDSALYHSSERHRLRETQIFALLLFLVSGNNRMLLEILTGEGKSTTVSCLAAILTISGYSVDIVTTSPLLASRDVDEKRTFFQLLGLEVAHNFEENQKNQKACYANNKIVYGTPHSFQVDILLNDYKKRNTRGGRPFEVLIVDEVDSMFIDQKEHQTLLATTYPGMSELAYPMKIIWNKINNNPIFKEDGKIKMAMALGSNKTVTGQAKAIMQEVVKDIRKKFQNEIIPEWRQDFIDESLEKWIQSAIAAAFVYKEKKHYLVKNGKIVPVDFKNNGTLQENVHWENGLHQFLQIKHGLTVNTEGMTSNFISNLGHFDKYKNLYGLTGTLGSNQSKQFLMNTYNAELFKVPPFKERRLKVEPGKVLYDETEWANYICESILQMLLCERSVLILCQTIQQVDLLQIALEQKNVRFKRLQILKFGEEKIDDKIDCEEIVIATNLAGRGADLKITSRLNQRGGLHVIITFMPINSRVEMQGRGRAGRNGYDGSSELAINYTKHCQQIGLMKQPKFIFQNTELSNPHSLIEIREQQQIQRMSEDDSNVKRLRAKDNVFSIYCKGMNEIPDFQKNTAKQKALEEQWAMFLKRADNRQLPYEVLQDEAIMLTEKLKAKSDDFYNPNHYVERGINEICNNNNQAAIDHFKKAQENNTGTLPQILGGMYENCCKINANKENKDNIKSCANGLRKVQGVVVHRKEMRQGFRVNDMENANITNFHNERVENEVRQFQRNLGNSSSQMNCQRVNTSLQNLNLEQNGEVKSRMVNISTGQDRILDGLSKHIDELLDKYSHLREGEYVQIDFRPISEILETIEGDQQENKEALDNLRPEGLQFLPKGVVKKKKVPWWKRVGVFLLGVAQIIVGSIIVASTAGALTGFGVTMMLEGAKYCFDSIFRPEQLEDLNKYFTKTAMTYAFALASSGLEGIKELGTLSQKGLKMFNEMPIGKFMQTTFKNVGKGFEIAFGKSASLTGGLKYLISSGVAQGIGRSGSNNDLRERIQDPTRRIQARGKDIKEQMEKTLKEEKKLDMTMEQVINNFTNQITKCISNCITKLDKSLLLELRNIPLESQHMNIVIGQALRETLKLPEGSSPEARAMMKLFSEKMNSNSLAQLYANQIGLEKKVEMCLKNIGQNKNYDLLIKKGLIDLIKQSLEKVINDKKSLIESQRDKCNQKVNYLNTNGSTMIKASYDLQVQNYRNMETRFNELVNKHNAFVEQHLNLKDLVESIENKKGIQRGKVKKQIISTLPVHEYVKEALNNLKYSDSSKSFEENLEAAIFNVVGNYGLKIIGNIYQSTNGSIDKLNKIAKMIRSDS